MKRCTRCGEMKAVSEFLRDRRKTDGLMRRCEQCSIRVNAYGRARRARNPEQFILAIMIQRCHNPKAPDYPWYGGRGIVVADEWRGPGGPGRFLLDIGPRPSPEHTVDRIDNARGYEPGNVRWVTMAVQARNRRQNRWIELDGVRMCLEDWAARCGMTPTGLSQRLSRLDIREALTLPVKRRAT